MVATSRIAPSKMLSSGAARATALTPDEGYLYGTNWMAAAAREVSYDLVTLGAPRVSGSCRLSLALESC